MGKKSRNNKSSSGNVGGGGCQYLDTVITTIKKYLDLAELQQLPMENYFPRHQHSVSSCDGDGAYNIYSLFVMSPSIFPPGSPEMGVITVVCMRVHDNIRNTLFLPSDSLPAVFPHLEGKSLDGCYTYLMEQNTKDAGNPYRNASFEVCKQLVNDCLLRMKAKKKVLVGKEERTVVRFFGLQSGDTFHKSGITLPRPAPAPSVEDIWLTLNRPEYYYFHVVGDLNDYFGTGYGEKRAITQGDFERAMTCIAEDEYRRERLLAMLYHMALWHMLEASEEEVSSWLLWERSGMMTSPVEHPDSTSVMKDSIVLQIVVNKYFDCGCGKLRIPQFPELGEYGYGEVVTYLIECCSIKLFVPSLNLDIFRRFQLLLLQSAYGVNG
jgi:hypothetical protein